MSPSGKYIGGLTNKAMEDNTWEYYPVIIDTETGEKIKLGPFPSALFKCSQPFAITDYGQLFISDHENGGSVDVYKRQLLFSIVAPVPSVISQVAGRYLSISFILSRTGW